MLAGDYSVLSRPDASGVYQISFAHEKGIYTCSTKDKQKKVFSDFSIEFHRKSVA